MLDLEDLYRRAQADTLLEPLMAGEITAMQVYLLKRVLLVGECWEWQGMYHHSGYGCLKDKGKFAYTHRASYEAFNGPLEGMLVCHTCDNPRCCNPKHLFKGTHEDNMADMKAKGRGRNQSSKG